MDLVRFHPSDRIVCGLLLLAVVVAAVGCRAAGLALLLTQLALLVAFGLTAVFLARWDAWAGAPTVRALATTTVVFTCYTTLVSRQSSIDG